MNKNIIFERFTKGTRTEHRLMFYLKLGIIYKNNRFRVHNKIKYNENIYSNWIIPIKFS